MKKLLLVLCAVTTVLFVSIQVGCSARPALDTKKEHPAPAEQKAEDAGEKAPSAEHPDSGAPKDHPAH